MDLFSCFLKRNLNEQYLWLELDVLGWVGARFSWRPSPMQNISVSFFFTSYLCLNSFAIYISIFFIPCSPFSFLFLQKPGFSIYESNCSNWLVLFLSVHHQVANQQQRRSVIWFISCLLHLFLFNWPLNPIFENMTGSVTKRIIIWGINKRKEKKMDWAGGVYLDKSNTKHTLLKLERKLMKFWVGEFSNAKPFNKL